MNMLIYRWHDFNIICLDLNVFKKEHCFEYSIKTKDQKHIIIRACPVVPVNLPW